MNDEKIKRVTNLANRLAEKPERWDWKITAVLYGHGKVIVQCVTPSGKAVQFAGKVNQ